MLKDANASILNKHLDELMYFFEVTKYNVVIIEDIDRFNSTDIFTKLREINILLNQSEQIKRRIIFVYATKDEVFGNEKNRTKFFDFIIPIIPVINSSNSSDILVKRLIKAGQKDILSKDLVEDISYYVDDMRILINVCNEFIVYKSQLNNIGLHPDKLFSLVLYKNLYPKDFSKLHSNEGMVHEVINNKHKIVTLLTKEVDQKIAAIELS